MSSNAPNGVAAPGTGAQKPTPPPGANPLRKPPNRGGSGNPLVSRKRVVRRPPPTANAPAASSVTNLPGSLPKHVPLSQQKPQNFESLRAQNGGWSFPKPEGANDYPLRITKRALKEGMRFHVMRLVPAQRFAKPDDLGVDPTNQNEFTRPVTLHRRDPRQPPPGRELKVEHIPEPPVVDDAEVQRLAQIKEAREAQRALDDAQKAPVVKEVAVKKKDPKKEKKPHTQVAWQPRTEQQRKEGEIRYEEALPWHLEDADARNVWVGQYEAPLSHAKVALLIDGQGFRMIPLEKWYRFTSKRGAIQAMTVEEAEKAMAQQAPMTRWAMRDAQREAKEKAMADSRVIMYGRAAVKQESASFRNASRREKMDHDDIDMSGDEFQDDDETAGYEPDRDEDTKDSVDRVRREQLGANLFGDANEKEVERVEKEELKEEEERKRLGKDLKKALRKRDKQFQYDSDSSNDRDPFATSSSESESDSDAEKKDDDKKGDKDKDKTAAASGTSSKGTNTPQGKKSAAEAAKKGKSLKRPGSPMASDSSGTESTRKKTKTGINSSRPSRGGTPLPGSQRGRGAGSGSDGEGTAGEMSDGAGGKKKRKGLLGGDARPTPGGSRAGSPAAAGGASGTVSTPRAGSPAAGAAKSWTNAPTLEEISAALPARPQGLSIGELMKVFAGRISKTEGQDGLMPRKEWLRLVKLSCDFGEDRLLRRKV
ncbi:hypothetical protein Micbo1qcDRAFT_192324 [Microdochium bolleyi]|uniref:Uncharacterized protein n=1 Tax=Microdochium bolleyi TaxID=196109 RepID=A0A136JDP2_9PEZI|nr:hypothetical protein Micbo1qcDRAFT_192324 [Microdochium bolleyi]